MKGKHPFHSFLKDRLATYLDFKQALGYTNYGSATCLSVAKAFDHYLIFRDCARLNDITEGLIHDWTHSIPRNSAKTKNKYLQFAQRFFDDLMRLGAVERNPARRIVRLKETPYRPYIFTLKELKGILQATGQIPNPSALFPRTMATVYYLLYACALRVGEAISLRICDVNFEENTLSLWKTKFHKERLVPFSEATAQKLATYLARRAKAYPPQADQDPFFVHRGKALYYLLVHPHFHRCLQICGIPHRTKGGARLHDLRHTAAVHRLYKWYQDGQDPMNKLPLLSTFMGHSHIAHTQVYLTISRDLLREGDRRFQAGFEDIAKKRLPFTPR